MDVKTRALVIMPRSEVVREIEVANRIVWQEDDECLPPSTLFVDVTSLNKNDDGALNVIRERVDDANPIQVVIINVGKDWTVAEKLAAHLNSYLIDYMGSHTSLVRDEWPRGNYKLMYVGGHVSPVTVSAAVKIHQKCKAQKCTPQYMLPIESIPVAYEIIRAIEPEVSNFFITDLWNGNTEIRDITELQYAQANNLMRYTKRKFGIKTSGADPRWDRTQRGVVEKLHQILKV